MSNLEALQASIDAVVDEVLDNPGIRFDFDAETVRVPAIIDTTADGNVLAERTYPVADYLMWLSFSQFGDTFKSNGELRDIATNMADGFKTRVDSDG